MSNYPPERDSANGSGDDDDNRDSDAGEEEEEEEELVEWTELTPLDELSSLEDGPSTYLVGGYSVCQHLGDAIDHVKYKEDIVVVFPGVYAAARPGAASAEALELNEARLGGLRIYGVAMTRELHGAGNNAASGGHSSPPKYTAASKRRVGPWFTWLTAAATATLLTQEGSAEGSASADGGSDGAYVKNPLKAAASRAVASSDAPSSGHGSTAPAPTSTTASGAAVFAPAITSTTANPTHFPVFDFPLSFVYQDLEGAAAAPLRHYRQEADAADDDAAEERDEEDDGDGNNSHNDGFDEDGQAAGHGQSGAGTAGSSALAASRRERAITLAGCCARAGLSLGALTRTAVQHCVIGSPRAATSLRIAVTAATLTEALVENCLVFGGTSYGVYAFPRCALTLQSTIIEGPNVEAENACGATAASAEAAAAAATRSAQGGSVIDQLEHRRARAQRLHKFLQRGEDAEAAAMDGDDGTGTAGGGSAYVDVEDGVLPRFAIPSAAPACEVGLMCDDADVQVADCLVSHTRLGVLLHGPCAQTKVRGLDIRSCAEAGLYVYGIGGAAEVVCSSVRACGRACLLLVGPSEAELAKLESSADATSTRASADEHEDDDETGEGGRRRPVLAQHPYLKSNTIIGAVRVQGAVLSGALVDNFVYLPKEEKSAAAVATAAQTLLSVDGSAGRGFTYVGVEGDRVSGKAAAHVAAY